MGLMGVHNNPLLSGSDDEAPQQTQQQQLLDQQQLQQQQRVKRSRTDSSVACSAAKRLQEPVPTNNTSCAAAAAALRDGSLLNDAAAAASGGVCSFTGNAVRDGDLVVLRDFAGRRSLARAQRDAATCEDACGSRFSLDLTLLPGSPFGASFSWDGCCWRRSRRTDRTLLQQVLGEGAADAEECVIGSNRDIVDCGDSQRLSASEIENLKCRASAADVLREVAANSKTFLQRTAFSQQKYLIKKAKRYVKQFTVLEATLRELCEFYFESHPTKIIGLRHDYLSCLLHSLCLEPHHKILVIDHAFGAPTAGVLMRLQPGRGRVFRLVEGGPLGDKVLRDLQLPPETLSCLEDIHIGQLLNILREQHENASVDGAPDGGPPSPAVEKEAQEEGPGHKAEQMRAQRLQRQREGALESLQRMQAAGGVDGFLAAVSPYKVRRKPVDTSSSSSTAAELFTALLHKVLLVAFRFLKPGARLLLFCQSFEAAGALHAALCASRDFVDPRLEELLLREFQKGLYSTLLKLRGSLSPFVVHLLLCCIASAFEPDEKYKGERGSRGPCVGPSCGGVSPQVVPGRSHPSMQSTLQIPSGFIVSATRIHGGGGPPS